MSESAASGSAVPDSEAPEVAELQSRLEALEAAWRATRDELEISRLIAAYGPLVDGGEADAVARLWTEDGIYDVDEGHMQGRDQIAAMVRSRHHQGYIASGCAHFLGPAHVTVNGDEAVAVCHSLMVVNDGGSFGSDSPAHFGIRRATAHHFELVRTAGVWQVATRTSRVLDGRAEAPTLLVRGVTGQVS